jgi:hypothetical protein
VREARAERTRRVSNIELRERFDCFAGTTKERTARKYGVMGVNVYGRKPM